MWFYSYFIWCMSVQHTSAKNISISCWLFNLPVTAICVVELWSWKGQKSHLDHLRFGSMIETLIPWPKNVQRHAMHPHDIRGINQGGSNKPPWSLGLIHCLGESMAAIEPETVQWLAWVGMRCRIWPYLMPDTAQSCQRIRMIHEKSQGTLSVTAAIHTSVSEKLDPESQSCPSAARSMLEIMQLLIWVPKRTPLSPGKDYHGWKTSRNLQKGV